MRKYNHRTALTVRGILLAVSLSFSSCMTGTLRASAAESRIVLDKEDYQVLLKIVEAEAGGEDETGKMLVANVILNRVDSDQFPDTVKKVVYQKLNGNAQFSPVSDGRIDSVQVSDATVAAVDKVLAGEDESKGAFFFRAVYCKSKWFDRKLTRVVEHGRHIFYTF